MQFLSVHEHFATYTAKVLPRNRLPSPRWTVERAVVGKTFSKEIVIDEMLANEDKW